MDNQSQLKARNFVMKNAHKFNRSAVFKDRKKAIKHGAKAKHRKAVMEAIKSAYPTLKTAGTHWSKPKDPFYATGLSKKAGMAKAYARTLIKHKHQMVPPTHWMTKKAYGSSTIKKLLSQQLAARRVRSEGATQPRMASGALLATGSGTMDDRKIILKKTIMLKQKNVKSIGNIRESMCNGEWIRVPGDHGSEYHSKCGKFVLKQTGDKWVAQKNNRKHSTHDSLLLAKKVMSEETTEDEHLYHVTHTKHVAKIQKHGLKPMQTSNWVQQGNKERYGHGEVYAFSHKDDAHKWAAHMDWEHHKELGTGKISVIKLKKPSDHHFDVDDSDPMSQAGKKGVWMKTHKAIHPSHIVSAEPYKGPPRLGEERIGKPSPSVNTIAAKHNVPVSSILAQLAKGIEVEKEHTDNESEAAEIARDHLHELPDYYDRLKKMENVKEDAVGAVNSVGGGNIAGMPTADPPEMTPVRKSTMVRRKKFAGKTVFPVDPNTYYKALLGKRKYEHYEKYLEGCDIAEEIREYGRTNWAESIILQNEKTGAMVYLKYGSK